MQVHYTIHVKSMANVIPYRCTNYVPFVRPATQVVQLNNQGFWTKTVSFFADATLHLQCIVFYFLHKLSINFLSHSFIDLLLLFLFSVVNLEFKKLPNWVKVKFIVDSCVVWNELRPTDPICIFLIPPKIGKRRF